MSQRATNPLYFVNAPVDFLCIGGISILCFLVFGSGVIEYDNLVSLAFFLLWIGNWPHFAASNYRLYSDKENFKQYPLTAFVVPFLILAGVVGAFLSPTLIAPFLVKLFLLWSPFHFSGQSIGITLLYSRRAGIQFTPLERRAFAGFIFMTFLFPYWQGEASPHGGGYYGIQYPGLGVPVWFATGAQVLLAVFALVLAARIATRYQNKKTRLPLILLLPAVTQFFWFVLGPDNKNFYMFVPFFHSAQYLFIAWVLQLKLKKDHTRIAPSKKYVATESTRWGVINFAGGVALFFMFPRFCALFGFTLEFATGIAIVGVQLHHFFVDGVIWKLRSPSVSAPLMVTFRELVKPVRRRPLRRAA